ncbi:hypothetical protein GCM10023087_15380 [Microbacterium rhizosphaerae]
MTTTSAPDRARAQAKAKALMGRMFFMALKLLSDAAARQSPRSRAQPLAKRIIHWYIF